ncbi:MAG: hypothetical protein LBR86_02500 [Tannerella sp.]|jgi:hypothetical protein|nr:hypothetical protein [Tannerella sp.]
MSYSSVSFQDFKNSIFVQAGKQPDPVDEKIHLHNLHLFGFCTQREDENCGLNISPDRFDVQLQNLCDLLRRHALCGKNFDCICYHAVLLCKRFVQFLPFFFAFRPALLTAFDTPYSIR